jgi:hypothetical protein
VASLARPNSTKLSPFPNWRKNAYPKSTLLQIWADSAKRQQNQLLGSHGILEGENV